MRSGTEATPPVMGHSKGSLVVMSPHCVEVNFTSRTHSRAVTHKRWLCRTASACCSQHSTECHQDLKAAKFISRLHFLGMVLAGTCAWGDWHKVDNDARPTCCDAIACCYDMSTDWAMVRLEGNACILGLWWSLESVEDPKWHDSSMLNVGSTVHCTT